jgi:hypothetical protein
VERLALACGGGASSYMGSGTGADEDQQLHRGARGEVSEEWKMVVFVWAA